MKDWQITIILCAILVVLLVLFIRQTHSIALENSELCKERFGDKYSYKDAKYYKMCVNKDTGEFKILIK